MVWELWEPSVFWNSRSEFVDTEVVCEEVRVSGKEASSQDGTKPAQPNHGTRARRSCGSAAAQHRRAQGGVLGEERY